MSHALHNEVLSFSEGSVFPDYLIIILFIFSKIPIFIMAKTTDFICTLGTAHC